MYDLKVITPKALGQKIKESEREQFNAPELKQRALD